MKIDDKDYILGVWFAEDKDHNSLVMFVKKGSDINSWEGQYTFRYKEDNNIFDSKDRKSVYSIKISNTQETEVVETMNLFFKQVSVLYSSFLDYLDVKGDFKKMMELGKDKRWFHVKKVPKD